MIQDQEPKTQQPYLVLRTVAQRGGRSNAFAWELRQTCTWIWILLLPIIVGSFLSTWNSYLVDLHAQTLLLANTHQKIKVMLDYTEPVRNTLELLLPIFSVFLSTDLLVKEWRRGTLAFIAARKPLFWFLAVRFGYLLGYLLLISTGAILLSWWLTPNPPMSVSLGAWLWQTLLTVMAPTLFLMALGLLVAHFAVNMTAGYILPACCWLANWLFALQVENAHSLNPVLSYLLFGWSDKDLTPDSDAWLSGKILLVILAVLLLSVQPLLLRKIALQHKEAE
ncbi:MAG TPA: hypothetical protein VFV38_30485 [Ktedonobacteraceae bacterium]|nr:hypothetical protein [Ktedonobacteraceae bacterium]